MQHGPGWILNINQLNDFLAEIPNSPEFCPDAKNISFPAFYNGLKLDPMVR
jgi:hypothetical protein